MKRNTKRALLVGAMLAGIAGGVPTVAFADASPTNTPTTVGISGYGAAAGSAASAIGSGRGTPTQSVTALPRRPLTGKLIPKTGLNPADRVVPVRGPSCAACTPAPPPAAPAAPEPVLFSYALDNHLKVGGGNFTIDGEVQVVVRYDTGAVQSSWWMRARTHSITPGGAIYADTDLIASCPGGPKGYIQAYDETTARFSNRVPAEICPVPQSGLSATAHNR